MKLYLNKILMSGVCVCIGGSFVIIKQHWLNTNQNLLTNFKVHALSKSKVVDSSTSELKLVSAQVFFRHGARLPLSQLPGFDEDDYDQESIIASVDHTAINVDVTGLHGSPHPTTQFATHFEKRKFKSGRKYGVLTALGKEQGYVLGQKLRRRYMNKLHLLSPEFDPQLIYFRSTNSDRTIETCQSVVAGFFDDHRDSKNVPTIEVASDEEEVLIPNIFGCAVLKHALLSADKSLKQLPALASLRTDIATRMGWNEGQRWTMMAVHDHITVRKLYGLPIDDYFIQHEQQIAEAAAFTLRYIIAGTERTESLMLKIAVGPLLNFIRSNLYLAATHSSTHKLGLYACHDATIASLLLAMGCFEPHWPPYCADLCVELYEDMAGQHWVRLVYCDKELIPRGCSSSLVAYKDFERVLSEHCVDNAQYTGMCSDTAIMEELTAAFAVDHFTM